MTTTLPAGGQLPVIRIRNQHAHTLKDGWRLSETTVEATCSLADLDLEEARKLLAEAQRQAHEAGQAEAEARNREAAR